MALLFSESFAGYTSSSELSLRGWTLTNSGFIAINTTGSPFGDNCLEITSRSTGGLPRLSKTFHATAGSGTTVRMAFWVKTDAAFTSSGITSSSGYLVALENNTPNSWLDTCIGVDGYLYVSRTETVRSASKDYTLISRTMVNDGQWHHVEIEFVISTTTGSAKLWIDGDLHHSVSGIDTSDGATNVNTYTRVTVSANRLSDTAQKVYIDDIMVWDDLGTELTGALTNHIQRQTALFPDGAGASAQFTPSAGSNYQTVDEAAINSDTDYNESSTAGHIDSFTFGNMPWSTDEVYAAVLSNIARSTVNTPNIRGKARVSGTYYNGTSVATTTAYTSYETVYADNPNATANWTNTTIDGAEFGYEAVSGTDPLRVTRSMLEVIADEVSTDEVRVTSFLIEVILEEGTAPVASSSVTTSTVVTN